MINLLRCSPSTSTGELLLFLIIYAHKQGVLSVEVAVCHYPDYLKQQKFTAGLLYIVSMICDRI